MDDEGIKEHEKESQPQPQPPAPSPYPSPSSHPPSHPPSQPSSPEPEIGRRHHPHQPTILSKREHPDRISWGTSQQMKNDSPSSSSHLAPPLDERRISTTIAGIASSGPSTDFLRLQQEETKFKESNKEVFNPDVDHPDRASSPSIRISSPRSEDDSFVSLRRQHEIMGSSRNDHSQRSGPSRKTSHCHMTLMVQLISRMTTATTTTFTSHWKRQLAISRHCHRHYLPL